MSRRFFAFGCSVTEFTWPTWADVIGHCLHSQGWEYYNFGNSGSGNQGIFYSMLAADKKYKFTDDDLIMVMWSSWNREDRFLLEYHWDPGLRGQWTKEGNILTAAGQGRFSADWIEKYWSLENDIVTNVASIEASRKMFNIAFDDTIPIWEAPDDTPLETDENPTIEQQIFNKYLQYNDVDNWQPFFNMHESYTKVDKFLLEFDGHPTPNLALEYVKTIIQPQIPDLELHNEGTREWLNDFENKIAKIIADYCIQYGRSNAGNNRSWWAEISKFHNIDKQRYTKATRFDLWEDQIFLDLLDVIKFKNYRN